MGDFLSNLSNIPQYAADWWNGKRSINPVSWAWNALPQNVRDTYTSGARSLVDMSTPASVRDYTTSAQDTARSAMQGDGWGTATNALGTVNAALGAIQIAGMGVTLARKGAQDVGKAVGMGVREAPFPQLGMRYPEIAPPVQAIDKKSQKPYLAKQLSPEAQAFQKEREVVAKDVAAGNYTPYFKPEERFPADISQYDPRTDTTSVRPVKAATQEKWEGVYNTPEAKQRLNEAYDRGQLQADASGNWYHMGQLENEFVKEYGAEEGRKLFKERFADAMAATTGGADPTSNLLMAHYGNYLKAAGQSVPQNAYDMPFPIGGRYASTNMDQFNKMIVQGQGVTPSNPKRYNFSGNFLGDSSGATIDEQMMGLIKPGMASPTPGTYGHAEGVVRQLANERGVAPSYFQEVAWAGAKDAKTPGGYASKPMVQHVNEAIERTSRLTGIPPEEVVRRGLVRAEMPLYGIGAAAVPIGLGQFSGQTEPQDRLF